jgi:hypothetical protein
MNVEAMNAAMVATREEEEKAPAAPPEPTKAQVPLT